jgi:hypothetical protein
MDKQEIILFIDKAKTATIGAKQNRQYISPEMMKKAIEIIEWLIGNGEK